MKHMHGGFVHDHAGGESRTPLAARQRAPVR